MQHLPSWFGGSNSVPGLQRWRADLEKLRTEPFDEVKNDMVSGSSLVDEGRGLTI